MTRYVYTLAAIVLTTACGAGERALADDGTRLSGHGLAIDLPPAWHGDVTKPDPNSAPRLRAATFPLLEPAVDLGQSAQLTLRDEDTLVSVVDYGRLPDSSDIPVASPPIGVTRSDIASFEGFREPVLTRSFLLRGHALQLWVVSGAPAATDAVLDRANDALATLSVVPRRVGLSGFSVEVPDGWTGYAKDLDPGDEQAPTVVVASVPWRDEGHNLAHSRPVEQFERLPPDGIVVAATTGRYPVGDPNRALNAPVRLSDGHFIAEHYEGQPAPHVSIQVISRPFGEAWVSALVFFGRNEPTPGMRAQADAVLGSLELR